MSNYTQVLNDSQSLTCEEYQVEFGSSVTFPVDPSKLLRSTQIFYYIVCFLVGVLLNLFLILLIIFQKKLHTMTFVLAVQILVSDLFSVLLFFPTAAANAIANYYVFTGLCTIIGFAFFFMRNARIYLMSVLVADRFSSVFMPFWYQRNRVKVVVVLSLGSWVLSLIIALVPIRGLLDCYSFLRETWACVPMKMCANRNDCSIYGYFMVALSQACNILILLLYLGLFFKARTLRNKVTTFVSGLTEQDKAAAVKRLERERRANVTFFLMFLALAGVSIPVGKIILDILGVPQQSSLYTLTGIIGWAIYHLLVIIDPIVMMRNGDFRQVLRDMLSRLKLTGTNRN